jgi:hypothetical protein
MFQIQKLSSAMEAANYKAIRGIEYAYDAKLLL